MVGQKPEAATRLRLQLRDLVLSLLATGFPRHHVMGFPEMGGTVPKIRWLINHDFLDNYGYLHPIGFK